MVHADMHSQNVLIQGEKLSVIDFDDAGFGWYGFDLAVAVWDRLDFTATGCHFDIAYESLIKGYLEERPNANDIIETIPTFLLMRTMMLIRWIEDRPEAGYEAFIPVLIQASIAQAKKLGFGWYGFDLAVAVWDRLDFTATGCHFDIAYESLIKGYLQERPNANDIIETIPTFLLMRTMMLIRWIEDRPEAGYEAFIPVLIQASIAQGKKLKLLD